MENGAPPYIILPYLRVAGKYAGPGKRVDPGLDDEPDPALYRPEYPLSPADARRRLARFRSETLAELRTARDCSDPLARLETRKLKSEWADLARFAGLSAPDEDYSALAQEIILRVWQMEGDAGEIAGIEDRCQRAERNLAAAFGEGPAEEIVGAADPDPSLLPAWRFCVQGVLYFCPPELPILIEGQMEKDFQEFADFAPGIVAGSPFLVWRAPLWRVLGRSRPATGDWESRVFNSPRTWLMIAEEQSSEER